MTNFKGPNVYVLVPKETKERKTEKKKLIMTKNFPNFMKSINPEIQLAPQIAVQEKNEIKTYYNQIAQNER